VGKIQKAIFPTCANLKTRLKTGEDRIFLFNLIMRIAS
jgi:hypothetical protein